jgi:hypothetical protein
VAIPQTKKRPVEEGGIVDPPFTSAVLEFTKEDLPLVFLESSTVDKPPSPLTANETLLSHISIFCGISPVRNTGECLD